MDMVLSELVTQMTQMNINLTTLITRQADLATRFDQNITGDGARPRDNNDTNVLRQPDNSLTTDSFMAQNHRSDIILMKFSFYSCLGNVF
jgi:hypothetical protein